MANRAAQLRAENPGLSIVKRTRNSIHFDLGNGQKKAVLSLEPLHIRNSETEIDATWVPDSGAWQHKLAACDFEVHARSVLNAGDVVQWLDPVSGESVILQPLALNWVNNDNDSRQQITQPQAVTAVADDATLNWPNGYGPGRHFRYTAHPSSLIKHLIIDSAASLPAPTVANPYLEIEFILKKSAGVTLYVDGAPWDNSTKTSTANRIEFRVNATGQTAWLFEAPGATDSSSEPNSTPGTFQLRRQGNTRYCTVRIPKAWIDSAVFPIYLDPTLTLQPDATDGKDAGILSEVSEGRYNNYGAITYFFHGRYGFVNYRHLLQFDISSIPSNATVSSATMTLTCYDAAQANDTVNWYYCKRAWVEGTRTGETDDPATGCTWIRYDLTNNWQTAGCDGANDRDTTSMGNCSRATTDALGTEKTVSLTVATVQDWVDGDLANNGMLGKGNNETSNSSGSFCSSDYATASYRPKLVVEYTEGGTTHNPAGVAAGSGSLAGALAVTRQLAAMAAGAGSATVSLAATRPVAGIAAGEATAAGALAITRPVAAAADGAGTAAAVLQATKPVAGTAAGAGAASASLAATRQMAAAADGAGTATANLTIGSAIAANAAGSATVAAALSVSKPVAAAADGAATVIADLAITRAIAAAMAGAGTAACALTVTEGGVTQELVAVSSGAGSASAGLSVTRNPVALTGGIGTLAASLSRPAYPAALSEGAGTASAALDVSRTVAGLVSGSSSVLAALVASRQLAANAAGSGAASCALTSGIIKTDLGQSMDAAGTMREYSQTMAAGATMRSYR